MTLGRSRTKAARDFIFCYLLSRFLILAHSQDKESRVLMRSLKEVPSDTEENLSTGSLNDSEMGEIFNVSNPDTNTDDFVESKGTVFTPGVIVAIALAAQVFAIAKFYCIVWCIVLPYQRYRRRQKARQGFPKNLELESFDHELAKLDIVSLKEAIDEKFGTSSDNRDSSDSKEVILDLRENSKGEVSLKIKPVERYYSVDENEDQNAFEQIPYEELRNMFQVPQNIEPNTQDQIITQKTLIRRDVDLNINIEKDVEIQSLLGSGSFGKVYKGTWTKPDTGEKIQVAVKFMNAPVLSLMTESKGQKMLKIFKEELVLMSKMRHPNIVRCYGGSLKPPNLAIVLEFMAGGNLHDYIHEYHKNEPMQETEIAKIVAHIAAGLNYLHPSIVHRDLKPHNVLLDEHGTPKIADFGLSKIRNHTLTVTKNQIKGTPQYIAPEVWKEAGDITGKCDIYALGLIAWEMFTREQPWSMCSTHIQILALVAVYQRRPEMPQNCPLFLKQLIEECWDQDSKRRPYAGEIHRQILWHYCRDGANGSNIC
eukprot:TRINITY_DN1431_c0_g1_i6.p1 TRINITY_DN1431_c0_g1~~TRINITY_DN1431_c0_g1_i6.p1  ORF type:complete len:538 (-),score=45.05 TRINITY_DN1431_c0_g1_i6:447-2060(-)